jgi:ubiquinone/menaquinone biosynthesis C-methylase UbiE
MEFPAHAPAVNAQYGRDDLAAAILAACTAAGKDPEQLTPADLAPATEFHIGGRAATLELARLAALRPGERVLDVGGGLGGPARTLAGERGCHVTVLDLTEEYCHAGETLTARVGLADRVAFRHGDATAMPFADAAFDAVWTQHSSMNIADKAALYREVYRVVRPGGRLALHEIMAGPARPIHFPVPWARDPAISFLRPPAEVRALLAATGFREVAWADVTGLSLDFFRERLVALDQGALPPVGLHLLLGDDFRPMFTNQARNLEESRIAVIQGIVARP